CRYLGIDGGMREAAKGATMTTEEMNAQVAAARALKKHFPRSADGHPWTETIVALDAELDAAVKLLRFVKDPVRLPQDAAKLEAHEVELDAFLARQEGRR